jgi:hypothetical protein
MQKPEAKPEIRRLITSKLNGQKMRMLVVASPPLLICGSLKALRSIKRA